MTEPDFQAMPDDMKDKFDEMFESEVLNAEEAFKRLRPGDEVRLFSRRKAPRNLGGKPRAQKK